jgi:hypothetical protein
MARTNLFTGEDAEILFSQVGAVSSLPLAVPALSTGRAGQLQESYRILSYSPQVTVL